MILNSINQTQLFGHKKLFLTLKDLFDNHNLPNKLLFSGQKGIGKCTLSYHLTNYIFSKKENFSYDLNKFEINKNNKSFKLICNNSHPNFFLINLKDDKKYIDITQIREMISFTNKSSFDNSNKIIMIDNLEYLNLSSANALLKVIEEPNEKVIFLLIHDNRKNLFNTLSSRCIKFKVHLEKNANDEILESLIGSKFKINLHNDFKNYYITPGQFINLYSYFSNNKLDVKNLNIEDFLIKIINDNSYKKDNYIKDNLINFIELYFFKKFYKSLNRNVAHSLYKQFLSKIRNIKKYNLDIESFLIEFKSKFING